MLFICGPAPVMIVLICACWSAVRFNLAYKCPGPWCQPCGPAGGGVAVLASSAALAIEMLVAAANSAPAASRVPASEMRIDFMFIAPDTVEEDLRRYPKPAKCKLVSAAMQSTVKNCKFNGQERCRRPTVPEYEAANMIGSNPPPTEAAAAREARVLLVDDDRELCQMLTEYLEAEHFDVKSVHDGGDALAELRANAFEILILDVMLPSVGGFDVLRKLGASHATPILMLTARGDDVDRIVGLELGADDYLSKPFNPRELVARIRAILRRASNRAARGGAPDELTVGPINLNTGTHLVHVNATSVPLTGAEFRVLELLMRSAGQVISRDSMTEQALGRKLAAYDRSIDTHISNLRRKLDLPAGKNPEIKNVRGSGYTLTWA